MQGSSREVRAAVAAVVLGLAALALFLMVRQRWQQPEPQPPAGRGEEGDGISSRTEPGGTVGFRSSAEQAGLNFTMHFLPTEQGASFKINLYDHGCGVVVGDYDGDGRDDIYFLNQLGGNALYRNRGDGTFEDVTGATGVALADRVSVGGVFADYDNDGDQDLFVTSTRGGNVLLRNENGQKFVDVTDEAGVKSVSHSQTALFFDYDRDGWLDLFVTRSAEWTMDERNEDGSYYLGKGGAGGLGEVITARREPNSLYRNLGNGRFEEVTEAAGLQGRGWAGDAAVFDYDQDGWPDLVVTSMFGRAQLYHNLRDGRFADVTLDTLGRTPFGAIGAKAFDSDNDGRLDLYIVDMHSDMWMGLDYRQESLPLAQKSEKQRFDSRMGPLVSEPSPGQQASDAEFEALLEFRHADVFYGNGFYRNLGAGRFLESSADANLENFWPWGIASGDFDNDGFEDLFVPAGMGFPFYYWGNYLLMNDGQGHFDNRARTLGIEPPPGGEFLGESIRGVRCTRSSRTAAVADFDDDGRLELVVNNFNDGPYLFHNEFAARNYVAFTLRGTRSNRDAIGALVRIKWGDQILVRQVPTAGGYLSQSSKTVHFGLGDATTLPEVEIWWPSGQKQTLRDVAVNQRHEVVEPEGEPAAETARHGHPSTGVAVARRVPYDASHEQISADSTFTTRP